ncbi:Acyl-CoA synthetase (AMP-forming)/AMP-acid ligase II [Streptomyces sp. yr375]|uniref:class I adenylate-forming enzyme family protein n=1 Tax=Streptomyces sp. yr375 TaxID=1761906 RepID=UPI0008D02250|nr:AMP-binding protein [Streptomyces sp. yr375]SEQ89886.1 Acyl-CoA synthetase (AMP-forming)/AMP-acid ligase II [Streptomyces sp. yr375]
MWLTQLLERNRQCFPERTALVDAHRSVTWADFHDRVARLAHGLAGRGIGGGDRVAVLSLDRVEVMETYFALARLGALFVPLNHSLTPAEVIGIAERCTPVAVIGESALLDRHPDLPVRLRIPLDDAEFAAMCEKDPAGNAGDLPDVPDDALAAILHTSATTGRAKGVAVDHASFRAIALGWLTQARPTNDIVLVNCCPLYHGSMVISLTYMAAGATVVLMPGFQPQRALAAIEDNRATHIWLVPQMLRFLMQSKSLRRTDLSGLREVLYGAAPMPPEVYAEAVEKLGCGFRQVYGMTEVGGPYITLGPDEHPAPGTTDVIPAGRVIPGMSVKALDEKDQEAAPGVIGEICARGPGVMRGYWNDEQATAEITTNGWTRTGDLGFIDGDGRVHLIDRCKDLIIRAGQNVYPREIEQALRTHPAVHDAAVVGVNDPDYGEVPLAFVVADPDTTPDEIQSHLTPRLATYKRPRHIRFIKEIPRNPAGKILKKNLPT